MQKEVTDVRQMAWLSFLLLSVGFARANSKIAMETRNGSFERGELGWLLEGSAKVVQQPNAPHGQRVLQCARSGDVARQVVIAEPETQYAVRVFMFTENVKPVKGIGYAYAAVYEFDFYGNLVAFCDFAKLTGTNDWRRFDATLSTHKRAFYLEIRFGPYNAEGTALFDAVQVARGDKTLQMYVEAPTVKGNIALILHEPTFPQNPASPLPGKTRPLA